MKFTYRSGQRPLDGYTIKRGVGQGGFGEVYFAVSDGGKEVALKLLRGHSDTELRGIAHCLNLKHPHLVHLYDLRADDRGDKWVVMEYVFGESLAQWINRYPTGLSVDLVKEWFAALARGVGYLHDHGVVHRDLKPANIFVEHGHLKIGDYGLSRRISSSQGGDLTRGVGTPHYMAPEIKNGNYKQSIDVYACGVILFEMLTGHPPFEGETPAEVLLKQQLDAPDLSRVPAGFRMVLEKALEKNPVKRFDNMREFARAVEVVASGRPMPVAEAATVTAPRAEPKPPSDSTVVEPPRPRAVPVAHPVIQPVADIPDSRSKFAAGPIPQAWRERLAELSASFVVVPVIAALCTVPWALFQSSVPWAVLGQVFILSTALSWGLLVVARPAKGAPQNPWAMRLRHLTVGLGVGALAYWLGGWVLAAPAHAETSRDLVLGSGIRVTSDTFATLTRYLFYFGLTTAAVRWWKMTDSRRKERFRFFPLVAATFWGSALLFLWPWEAAPAGVGIAPLVVAAVAVQVACPWTAPVPVARPVSRADARRARAARYAV